MKKTIVVLLLLTSFSIAEEVNNLSQKYPINPPENLQALGRGYAKDPQTNQIYYDGKLIEVYSPKTFTVINKDNENGYDAEDYYTHYTTGKADVEREGDEIDYDKAKVPLRRGPKITAFDYALNVPAKCFDDKDVPADLLKCYQKHMPFDIWSEGIPLNPDTFNVLGELTGYGWVFVTDGHRVIALTTNLYREFENFSIDNIDDLSSFQFVGKQSDSATLSARAQTNVGYGYGLKEMTWNQRLPWETDMALRLHYFKDKKYVYANHLGVIEEADPETFELLTFPYAKDKDHIFYNGKVLKDANRDEFEILDYRLKIARDKTKIFYKDHVLKELEVETFKLVISPERGCPVALLMDKKSTYYIDALLFDEPEYPIFLAVGSVDPEKNSYSPNRLYGMVSLPLSLLDYSDINMLKGGGSRCRDNSSIDVMSKGKTFYINRLKSSMRAFEIREEDFIIYY